jgi:hypothetical protein
LITDNAMHCRSCASRNLRGFSAEIGIDFPGIENIDEPPVFVFPQLVVCLDYGFAQFTLPKADRHQLAIAHLRR